MLSLETKLSSFLNRIPLTFISKTIKDHINVSCSSKELSVYFKTAHSLYLKLFFFQYMCVFSDMEGKDIQFTAWKTHRECVFKRKPTPEDKFSMDVIGCKGINKLITVQPMVALPCYFKKEQQQSYWVNQIYSSGVVTCFVLGTTKVIDVLPKLLIQKAQGWGLLRTFLLAFKQQGFFYEPFPRGRQD